MSDPRPTTLEAARAAAYLATRERLDFRTGKTRATVQCNPPNVRCGDRCIPPTWDCRLKGQGNDPHLAARRTDPVGGLANIERGIKRLGKFTRTGSFSELESSKRSLVRGAVKLKPGTLKEKNEFKAWIEQNWSRIAIPVTIASVGLFAHAGLKSGNVFGYREGAGAKIDRAVHNGVGAVLDVIPGVGQARAYTRRRAAEATAFNLQRVSMRTQRKRSLLTPEAGIPGTPIPSTWKTSGGSDLNSSLLAIDNAVKGSDAKALKRKSTFYDWNTDHNLAFWGATHPSSGRSVFAEPSAKAFLNDEWRLNLPANADASAYRVALANRIASESDTFIQLAKQQGFKALGTPGEQYLRNEDIDAFIVRNTQGMPPEVASAHGAFLRTAVRRGSNKTKANVLYAGNVRFYDKYFKERVVPNLKDVAGAPAFDPDMRGAGAISLRAAAQKRRTDFLIQTSNKPNKTSAGISHDELFMLDYYHTKVVGYAKSPYIVSSRLAVTAASELSGKTKLTPTEAIDLLNNTYGFRTAQLEQRASAGQRPLATTSTPEGGRPARRMSDAQRIAAMMRRKNPDGTPIFATREAAEAELRRMKRQDAEELPPRVRTYLEVQARLDKRCGKSGIPENRKCTKTTPVQSKEAAQRARGAAEPGVTCAPGTQQCGKICIPQSATCHIKAGGSGLDNAAKVAAIAGGVASVIGVARNRKTIAGRARQGTLQARRTLRTSNREVYRATAVRARTIRRTADNVRRTQTERAIAEVTKRTIKTLSRADVDAGISRLPENFQDPVRKLVGDAKLSAAHIALKTKGGRITSVNNADNFSNWEMKDGTLLSTGSVGETLVIYNTRPQDSIGGVRTYSTQFRVDGEFDAKSPAASRNAKSVASTVKKMFQSQMEQLPDRSIITAIPYANDNKGRKRRSIYERYGFRQALTSDERLFAMKRDGKFMRMGDNHMEQIADLIRNDSRSDGFSTPTSLTYQRRFDFTPSASRTGKPCGKSFIPKNQNCSKTTTAKYANKPNSESEGASLAQKVGVGAAALTAAGAIAGLVAVVSNKKKVSAYRKNVSKSAVEAEKLSIEFERQFREQAAQRLKKRPQDVTGFEASVYNYNDKGFDRGFGAFESDAKWFGQTQQSKGAVVMLSYADAKGKGGFEMANGGAFQTVWGERDILPYANNISQPKASNDLDHMQQLARERAIKQAERVAGPLGKGVAKGAFTTQDALKRFEFLRKNVDERGFNPDAVRAAAFVVAQRRLTGKPVDIMSYSNGGNVATETLAILSEMGYRDVKVINVAGPTFGIFSHSDDNMRTWVSEGDEFYQYSGGKAYVGGNTRMLKNKNIPHGLRDGIDPNNREAGANWRQNIKDKKSYLLDEQLQQEAYQYLTVDNKRANELVNEVIWRVGEDMKFEGDLGTLFGGNSTIAKSRFKGFLESLPRDQARQQIKAELEGRMLDVWYGGYNPKQVKNAQKAIRQELLTYTAPQRPAQTRPPRPASLSQRIERLMEQNPGMSREAARRQIQEQMRRQPKTDAYDLARALTLRHLRAA